MNTAVVTVTTTPTLLCEAKPATQRQWITVQVPAGSGAAVHVGPSDVTDETGHRIPVAWGILIENDTLAKPGAAAWYGVTESGSVDVIVTEGV